MSFGKHQLLRNIFDQILPNIAEVALKICWMIHFFDHNYVQDCKWPYKNKAVNIQYFFNKVQLQLVSQIFEYHLVRWWISMSPCMKWFQTNTLKCSTSNQNSKCNLGRSLFFFMHISTVKTGWFSTFWSYSTCWVFHTKGMSIQHSLFLPLGKIL